MFYQFYLEVLKWVNLTHQTFKPDLVEKIYKLYLL